jgi:uncharacterized membrane protein YheB (UPF0754 family)
MTYSWALIPLIAAFIGWFTIWLSIRLLFHPREPIRLMGMTFQGIFPRHQQRFAENLGKLVTQQLVSFSDIEHKILHPDNVQKIMPLVEEHIDSFLRIKLPQQMPVIGMFIGDKTIAELKAVFTTELETLFPVIMGSYLHNLEKQLDLEKLVTDKIAGFSTGRLEHILNSVMLKEFRAAQLAGAVIGFVLGLVQLMVLWWLG